MKLNELSPAPGSKKGAKRIGRGHGYDGDTVDANALVKAGVVKGSFDAVKVLGNGKLDKKLTVKVSAFSESAKAAIEAAGGKAEVV